MASKLYAALKEANVSEESAVAAAEEVAAVQGFASIEAKLDALRTELGSKLEALRADLGGRFEAHDTRLHKVESNVKLLKWMTGTNVTLTLAVLATVLAILLHMAH